MSPEFIDQKWQWWKILLWAYSVLYVLFWFIVILAITFFPTSDSSGSYPIASFILGVMFIPVLVFLVLIGKENLSSEPKSGINPKSPILSTHNLLAKIFNKESKFIYVLGGLSYIPLIGVPFGIITLIWGILIRKKVPIILGLGGILLTIIIYSSLFYFGFVAKYGPYHELKKGLTKQLLTDTRGAILIYKERNGRLPDSLDELGKPTVENFYTSTDPWMNNIEYTINEDGTFELRSFGPDEIPHNFDDIVSSN